MSEVFQEIMDVKEDLVKKKVRSSCKLLPLTLHLADPYDELDLVNWQLRYIA
jgi:hypothetical protein